jgi:two-component system LytT family sensor kinase
MASKINLQMLKGVFKHRFFIHLIIWLLYIGYEVMLLFMLKVPIKPLSIIMVFTMHIGLFYFCTEYLFPVFLNKRRVLWFIVMLLLTFITYISLFIVVDLNFPPYWVDNPKDMLKFSYLVFRTLRGTRFVAFATAYWVIKKLVAAEKDNNTLLKKKYILELREKELNRAIINTELAYVRAQINPHFLFNTLNFLYLNTYPLSKDIAKSILILSDIMRFVIESNKNNGPTGLALEIKHIENYIKLNQLRFHHNLYIDFEYTGAPENKKITPFILMTLVENAFKHGDLMDVRYPLKIQLNMMSESIRFFIANKINTMELYEKHGIGMTNLERCLELFYGNRYSLNTQNDGKHYSCELEIEL